MGNFLGILLLFFAIAAHAVVPSGVPSANMGGGGSFVAGVTSSFPGNMNLQINGSASTFTLHGGTGSCSGGNAAYPLFRNGSAGSFAPTIPIGKSWRCYNLKYRVGSATGGFQFFTSPTAFPNAFAGASITNGTFQFGAVSTYGMHGHTTANTPMVMFSEYDFSASATAVATPGFQCADNTQLYDISLDCQETTP